MLWWVAVVIARRAGSVATIDALASDAERGDERLLWDLDATD